MGLGETDSTMGGEGGRGAPPRGGLCRAQKRRRTGQARALNNKMEAGDRLFKSFPPFVAVMKGCGGGGG